MILESPKEKRNTKTHLLIKTEFILPKGVKLQFAINAIDQDITLISVK